MENTSRELSPANLRCMECEHFKSSLEPNETLQPGIVLGICEVVENIGEFNNAIYCSNPYIPCSGYQFEELVRKEL